MMYHIAICDDLIEEREQFTQIVQSIGIDPLSIQCFESGESLFFEYNRGEANFDLIFLDIYMDGMNGMEIAIKLREQGYKGAITFLTTSKDFAIESYEVEAIGYLIKPLTKEQVEKIFIKFLKPKFRPSICLLVGREKRYFYLDDIAYLESRNHDILVNLISGEVLRTRGKLADVETKLDDPRFLSCHKSFLVNMQLICDVKEGFILKNGADVPIKIRGRNRITEMYYSYYVSYTIEKRRF